MSQTTLVIATELCCWSEEAGTNVTATDEARHPRHMGHLWVRICNVPWLVPGWAGPRLQGVIRRARSAPRTTPQSISLAHGRRHSAGFLAGWLPMPSVGPPAQA